MAIDTVVAMLANVRTALLLSVVFASGCPEPGTESPATSSSDGSSDEASAGETGTPPQESTTGSTGIDSADGGSTSLETGETSGPGSTTQGETGVDACANEILDGDETDVDCGGSCPACPIGGACEQPEDCADAQCESGSCLGQGPTCDPGEVQGNPGNGWSDSYSVDGQCFCDSTFDHAIGEIEVDTPYGIRTVLEICEAIGPGPGAEGHPVYNDIQCGNGPANDAGDEDWCPGRVDQGAEGCCIIGPMWDLSVLE